MRKSTPKLQTLVTTEPIGSEGHTKAHYRFDKCQHMDEKMYAPGKVPPKTRKVRCYSCDRFRVLAGWS